MAACSDDDLMDLHAKLGDITLCTG